MRTRWEAMDWFQFATAVTVIPMGFLLHCAGILLLSLALAGNLVVQRFHLRLTHNRAWLTGRIAIIGSLLEAQRRNMSLTDWLVAEAERDGFGDHIRAAIREADEG